MSHNSLLNLAHKQHPTNLIWSMYQLYRLFLFFYSFFFFPVLGDLLPRTIINCSFYQIYKHAQIKERPLTLVVYLLIMGLNPRKHLSSPEIVILH